MIFFAVLSCAPILTNLDTDEIEQTDGDGVSIEQDNRPRFESLSREASPSLASGVAGVRADESRKRQRSQSITTQNVTPQQKKVR
jgi:hypothetical protein